MLYLPKGTERVVPDWFASQLRALDPNLIVYWNPHRGRWILDRCTRGGARSAAAHDHTPDCPKTNVKVIHDEGRYMPLCQRVLDELRRDDAWAFASLEQFERHHDAVLAEDEAKRHRQVDALYADASKDNRRQLLKAYDIVQIHDVHRINQ